MIERDRINNFINDMANNYNITPLTAAFEFDTAYCLILNTDKAMKYAEEKIRGEYGEKSKKVR